MNNSSKQIMLSVIGVAILVIAVVGVSFAFFTYTRTGTTDNVITTGTLAINFEDGNFINLQNEYPINTTTGQARSTTGATCTFTVKGQISGGGTLNYTVYAVKGGVPAGLEATNKLPDQHVCLYVTAIGGTLTTDFGSPGTATPISSDATDVITGTTVGTSRIIATNVFNSATEATHTYTVRMWIDDSIVQIGEDAINDEYTTQEFASKYYSMKIMVVSNA